MASTNEKCLKCRKIVPKNKHFFIKCHSCFNWLHFRCTNLQRPEFDKFKKDKKHTYLCQYCLLYKCLKCKFHVLDKDKGIQCDSCDSWIHIKCTNLTNKDYEHFINNNELPWYCKLCMNHIFPFTSLDPINFSDVFKVDKYEQKSKMSNIINVNKLKNECPVCTRKLNKPLRGIPCLTCKSLVHRRCSKLSTQEINLFFNSSLYKNYECYCCMGTKFALNNVNDETLYTLSFNSNMQCPCLTHALLNTDADKYKLKFDVDDYEKELNFSTGPDILDYVNVFTPAFEYYDVHKFHKLAMKDKSNTDFSIFHTNICSLQGNFEKLEILLHDLDYRFSVIALTETWNAKINNKKFSPGVLEGYQRYDGMSGTTLKSGCGFYVLDGIHYIPKKDLDINVCDGYNEYQFKWIEIINVRTSNFLICVCYRHPKKGSDNTSNERLKQILQKITQSNQIIYICGDFNYNLLKYNCNNCY